MLPVNGARSDVLDGSSGSMSMVACQYGSLSHDQIRYRTIVEEVIVKY